MKIVIKFTVLKNLLAVILKKSTNKMIIDKFK
jgi:hypothetical protein